MPTGFRQKGKVLKLKKTLYGLRQSPRLWYQTLISYLHTLGFQELITDSCVMKHKDEKCFTKNGLDINLLNLNVYVTEEYKKYFSIKTNELSWF